MNKIFLIRKYTKCHTSIKICTAPKGMGKMNNILGKSRKECLRKEPTEEIKILKGKRI